jgi:hypothetical protein
MDSLKTITVCQNLTRNNQATKVHHTTNGQIKTSALYDGKWQKKEGEVAKE